MTTPEKFYFDEAHYVPAARAMLEPVLPSLLLNPMHPPLAKELMAVSIRVFGDVPLGWRYPSVLFGSLAIVAMYLCGLSLFTAQSPAVASALIAFFNQMVFVQSRIAMLDISALAFGLLAIAAFIFGFRKRRPHVWLLSQGWAFGLSVACKWSGLFALAVFIVIVAVIRLMQSWQFADYALRRGNSPRWLLWAFVATAFAGFAAVLPIFAAFVGTSMETFNRLMIFQNWI